MLTNEPNDDIGSDERIKSKYLQICEQLNIDQSIVNATWDKYQAIRNDHTLENGQMQWLCCALYVSLSSKTNQLSEISLTKLLRLCNIKIYEFLKKTEQWISMASAPSECRDKYRQLSQSLSVSILAYEKYLLIFRDLFTSPTYADDAAMAAATITTPQKNSKKAKLSNKCTPNDVYEFCWYLFILARGENPEYTLDLVTSFHVLLCCIDLIFANIVADKRDDLINPNFSQTAASLLTHKERIGKNANDAEAVSIMKELCDRQNASEVETLAIKSHNWKSLMQKFLRDGILKGNATSFLGLLSTSNYDFNIKSLKRQYEVYLQRSGKIDEGIFLLQAPSDNHADPRTHSQILKSYVPNTPLTCRTRLPATNHELVVSPVSNATQNVSRLHQCLGGCNAEPSKSLKDLFSSCGVNPFSEMEVMLQTMRDKFLNAFRTNSAGDRFELAVKLYYNLLERIIKKERSQKQNFDPKILRNERFHKMLIAVSIEVVIYAYGGSNKFPWILDCFGIDAFYFYKLIEIIVSNEEGLLNRDLIKHLNAIEEQCLESLAWKSDSPLWREIADWKSRHHSLPKEEDTISSSIGLFFRKFYKLAFVRIEKLAIDLELDHSQYLQKIWTTFEYSILYHIDLMKGRHLDQMIMCSIYIFARARNLQTRFKDIMAMYRNQPQAESSIYREVLGQDNTRYDIIEFYNRIYVRDMQGFVLRLRGSDDVTLSPLPVNVRANATPRKISQNLYLYELQSNEKMQSPDAVRTYQFMSSPIQNFRRIESNIVDTPNANGKRTLSLTESEQSTDSKDATSPVMPYTNKKLRSLMSDRQTTK